MVDKENKVKANKKKKMQFAKDAKQAALAVIVVLIFIFYTLYNIVIYIRSQKVVDKPAPKEASIMTQNQQKSLESLDEIRPPSQPMPQTASRESSSPQTEPNSPNVDPPEKMK